MNGKKLVSAVVATSLAGTLAAPALVDMHGARADAATEASAAEASSGAAQAGGTQAQASGGQDASAASGKNETVYVKADAAGATMGVYVVNMFDTGTAKDVSDPADYTSVANLSTSDVLVQEGGAVKLRTLEGEPFYYQGDLAASTRLPWDIRVRYFLNGVETSADEMAGAEGAVRVELEVRANTEASGGVSDFADSYALQAQGTFPEEGWCVEGSSNATVARAGSNTVASCMVLPGESKTFVLEGQARGFTCDGWQISAMPLSLAMDLADEDSAALSDKAGELEDGTTALADGAGELSSGLDSLEDGAAEVEAGARLLASGTATLQEKTQDASAGMTAITAQGSVLRDGWDGMYDALRSLADAMSAGNGETPSLSAASTAYAAGLAQSRDEYAQAAQATAQAQQAYESALAAVQVAPSEESYAALNQAVQALAQANQAAGAYAALDAAASQYAAVDEGVQEAAAGAAALASDEGAGALSEGIAAYTGAVDEAALQLPALEDGIDQAASGATQLASGTGALSAASSSAASGAGSLADGARSLADAVDGIDEEILDELQEAIDDKLGADFELHSFVVPSNTDVNAVQFVYVVDGVSEPDAEEGADAAAAAGAGETQDSSSSASGFAAIWDRLLALFN